MTYCPDCGREIPSDEFVAHREVEHPPTEVKIVTIPGPLDTRPGDDRIGERMGWSEE